MCACVHVFLCVIVFKNFWKALQFFSLTSSLLVVVVPQIVFIEYCQVIVLFVLLFKILFLSQGHYMVYL